MSDLARQSLQRVLIPEEALSRIRAGGAALHIGLPEETLSNIRAGFERLQRGLIPEEALSNIRASQVRLAATLDGVSKSFRGAAIVVPFPSVSGVSSPAIIRPDAEDVINVDRGRPVKNKGGRPSHHAHHHERISYLIAHGAGYYEAAYVIFDEAVERVKSGGVPKGTRAVTDNPEHARKYGLVCSKAKDPIDSLAKYIKRIAPEILGAEYDFALR